MRKGYSLRAQQRRRRSLIEGLESRQMLSSVVLSSGIVTLTGNSSGSNNMSAGLASNGDLKVQVNGIWKQYRQADVSKIKYVGGSGVDTVFVDDKVTKPFDIRTAGGNDAIRAGAGTDYIDAGDGNDLVYTRGGNDSVIGGTGNDTIIGSTGAENINGGLGDDFLQGYQNSDTIVGSDGNDSIEGGDGNDTVTGDIGTDKILGGAGNDTMRGGDGNDTLTGHSGSDLFDGGAGTNSVTDKTSSDTVVGSTTSPTPTPAPAPTPTPTPTPTPAPTTPTTGVVGMGAATVKAPTPASGSPQAVMNLLGLGAMAGSAIHVNGLNSVLNGGSSINARYAWDFGDPTAKYNKLEGFNASHHYANPGTYTITLSVTNEAGKTSSVSTNVFIAADTRKTIYVDAVSGNDSNNGLSTGSAVKSASRAMDLMRNNTKVLFKRGQSWNINETFKVPYNNVIVGAYGTGDRPVLSGYMGPTAVTIALSTGISSNVVIQDITLDTQGASNPAQYNMPIAIAARGENIVVRNVEFRDVGYAISGNSVPHYVLVQDNTAPQDVGVRGYLFWMEGSDFTIIGNYARNSTREHILRSSSNDTTRVLIAHNNFTNLNRTSVDGGDESKTTINIRAGSYVYIAHNKLNDGVLGFGPTEAMDMGDAARNIVVDGNHVHNARVEFAPNTWDLAMRNNFVDLEDTEQVQFRAKAAGYTSRTYRNIGIYNNTSIVTGADAKFIKVYTQIDAGAITVLNNLMAAPNLNPGTGSFSGGIDVRASNASMFKYISNNVWAGVSNTYPSYGGMNYINPGLDFNGYLTGSEWNALSNVGNDQFADISTSSVWSAPVSAILTGGGTNAPGVFTDYSGKLRSGTYSVGAME